MRKLITRENFHFYSIRFVLSVIKEHYISLPSSYTLTCDLLILTIYVKRGNFAQVKLLYMVFASKGSPRSNNHCFMRISLY